MEDIRSVLSQYHSKKKRGEDVQKSNVGPYDRPVISEIPDVFFDDILLHFKLSRAEISLLMLLYRQIWCRPNLYRPYGIGPLNSYNDMSTALGCNNEELGHHLRSLENYGLIETIRSGQYFVRKFFTENLDVKYGQHYDEFF